MNKSKFDQSTRNFTRGPNIDGMTFEDLGGPTRDHRNRKEANKY